MRTTLTIDDDLAGILRRKARQQGRSLKEIVNQILRAGISAINQSDLKRERVTVPAKPLGLKPGYDPDKLNQWADELAVEDFLRKQRA